MILIISFEAQHAQTTITLCQAKGGSVLVQDALIYEVHVRAFLDSNGDGIGDFPGLTQKLDYIQDLGVTAIWLLPFYPSPLKDDGYDIADYFSINPIYGTLKDFNSFLQEAHQRNLRVITELVVNHTSDAHPWFQASRRAKPGSSARNYYVWSDTPDKYREARIIFRDFEPSNWTWDPVANSYFWHRFYSHQPDLNYDNPQVHKEIIRALDFWLDLGVDGLRLDAVPYLYEREGTSCENLKETHDYLKTLRRHIDTKYGDRMLLAEANQWPEEAVTYFGQGRGDECHMAFHFPLMPRIFMSVRMEDRVPIVDILDQTPAIPETSQWALFLRNHDELTLEMVTDEERDYMYRVYANDARARINLGIRRRLAPLLGNSRRRIELLYMLLLSLPGTPVLYYGDELGMGDNVFLGDRNGVRTPMHWNSDRNAGFSRASPQALYLPIILDPEYHYEAINAEAQRANPNSLWWWMKRVLTLRQRYQAFGRGKLEFLKPENRKILAFTRTYEDQTLLVVANLSRFTQPVRLDLAQFNHSIPVELFGQTEFPAISESPYFLTLAPHAAFWFALESVAEGEPLEVNHPMGHVLSVTGPWESILENEQAALLQPRLLGYLRSRRWFGQKSREVTFAQIQEVIPVPFEMSKAYLLLLQIEYTEGDPSEYILPVAFAATALAQKIESDSPRSIICRLRLETKNEEGVLYEAFASREFCRVLFDGISRRRSFSGLYGELKAIPAAALKSASSGNGNTSPEPELLPTDQSNTSIVFGQKYFLKLFRRVENGTNPDLEIGRFLTERNFANIPRLAGSLEYRGANGKNFTVGMMTQFLPEAKNAWEYALETLSRYFDRVRTASPALLEAGANQGMFALAQVEPPEAAVAMVGTSLETARLLGQRTGELHLELAADRDNKDFAPEPFTPFYQRSLYQSMRNQTMNTLQLLRQSIARLPSEIRQKAEEVANRENEIISCFQVVCERPISGQRIRCHGDFHLGQILYTGKDFMVIDFEGEPARPLGERRIKRTPLRDVAAMLRSFDYITHAALFKQIELGGLLQEHLPQVEPWTGFWYRWVSAVFLKSYLSVLGETDLLPKSNRNLTVLLNAQLLEKALYEISYELNNRPDWVKIPLHGILRLLDSTPPESRPRTVEPASAQA